MLSCAMPQISLGQSFEKTKYETHTQTNQENTDSRTNFSYYHPHWGSLPWPSRSNQIPRRTNHSRTDFTYYHPHWGSLPWPSGPNQISRCTNHSRTFFKCDYGNRSSVLRSSRNRTSVLRKWRNQSSQISFSSLHPLRLHRHLIQHPLLIYTELENEFLTTRHTVDNYAAHTRPQIHTNTHITFT